MQKPDLILGNLIRSIDASTESILTCTLAVNGVALTGTLIPVEEYARYMINIAQGNVGYASGLFSSEVQFLGEALGIAGEQYREQVRAATAENLPEHLPLIPEYLHLKNAYLAANEKPVNNGGWLRVRLTDISAWSV